MTTQSEKTPDEKTYLAALSLDVTLYIDKTPFRRALQLPDEDHVYVLAVDRKGHVLARVTGLFTPESGDAFSLAAFPAPEKR